MNHFSLKFKSVKKKIFKFYNVYTFRVVSS